MPPAMEKLFLQHQPSCPRCQKTIENVGTLRYPPCVEQYIAKKTALPICPISPDPEIPAWYVCDPCGCSVSVYYVHAHLRAQTNGDTAKTHTFTLAAVDVMLAAATDTLTRLHMFVPKTDKQREAKAVWTEIVATQLIVLSDEIVSPAPEQTFLSIYLQPNGMYATTPAYSGQLATLTTPEKTEAYVMSGTELLRLPEYAPETAATLFPPRKARRRVVRRVDLGE